MNAIVMNRKTVRNVNAAERFVNAVKNAFRELVKSWAEMEAYWNEHPETRPAPHLYFAKY